ncbi:hypothetical protein LOD99_9514 [Oopsacas minuta]|uniref:Uncharacterized protein n=1 Tax=Oopsacas minuta TaxID=111878 RepID=A0AAV7JBH4_9METZ|nr:hypothetical protein LOD99_9514 [Oopsacas minuta]
MQPKIQRALARKTSFEDNISDPDLCEILSKLRCERCGEEVTLGRLLNTEVNMTSKTYININRQPSTSSYLLITNICHKKFRQTSVKSIAKLQAKYRNLREKYEIGMEEILILRQEREEAAQERKQMREEIAALQERLTVFESRLSQIYNLSRV